MLAPTFLYASGKLGQAPLFDGDSRKEMTCITCDGLGVVKAEPCPTCYGRGVADYIIPGPNRPTQLVGTVLDARKKKLEGAEVTASVVGQDEVTIVMKSNGDGQFGLKLPPGTYNLSLKHDATKLSAKEELTVVKSTDPIPTTGSETLAVLDKTFTLR